MNLNELTANALEAYRSGDLEHCANLCRQVLAEHAENPDANYLLGVTCHRRGKYTEAIKLFEQAIAQRPQKPSYLGSQGITLVSMRQYFAAEQVFRKAIELAPDNLEFFYKLGICLYYQGNSRAAVPYLQKCLEAGGKACHYHTYGLLMRRLDRPREAEQAHLKVLELDPDHTGAWYYLVQLRDYQDPEHPDIHTLQQLLERQDWPPVKRAELHCALGKCLDDCGEYPQAFEQYRAGNRLMAEQARYDTADFDRQIAWITRTFSDPHIFDTRAGLEQGPAPLFIVGMQCSGKTWLERLLSRYTDIHRGCELLALPMHSVGWLWERPGQMDKKTLREAARRYRQFTQRLAPEALYVTDTLPANVKYLGYIPLLFPDARIIHCQRDPLDTLVSIYFKYVGTGTGKFNYRLEDIRTRMQQHRRLMDFWRDHLPVPILEIHYEDMVTRPAEVAQQAIEFCGLESNESLVKEWNNAGLDDRWVGHANNYRQYLG